MPASTFSARTPMPYTPDNGAPGHGWTRGMALLRRAVVSLHAGSYYLAPSFQGAGTPRSSRLGWQPSCTGRTHFFKGPCSALFPLGLIWAFIWRSVRSAAVTYIYRSLPGHCAAADINELIDYLH